ncbi:hypothetical protein ACFYW6_31285 [Streptomyces sp. NPDC002659]|uniref:hypothetical protein n=1 Tax=unclassified Streptomyces TaxID=2593676 RepID=UPI0034075993
MREKDTIVKKLVPVAVFMGLVPALLGGASTASATGHYSCSNGLANVVTCNNTNTGPVSLKITGNRTLTDNELSVLENNLNNAAVNVTALKNVTANTYKSFNPSVTIKNINVCIASVCS